MTARTAKILILGGGFAGAYCAQACHRALKGLSAGVCLVDQHNYFVFTPLLVETGTGAVEPRHTVVPLRSFLGRNTVFRMATVREIDLEERVVRCQLVGDERIQSLSYDHLVLALGSVSLLPRVPGLREYAFLMKNLGHAVLLRDRLIQMLELADACGDPELQRELLHFVVVGGSFTGAEVAGGFFDFLRAGAKHYPNVRPEMIQMTVVERGTRLLEMLPQQLSEHAARQMRRRGIDLRLAETVVRIQQRSALLASGTLLPTRTVIWTAGVAPHPLLARLDLPRDEKGYLRCDGKLRLLGHENVWAIGDCAANPDPSNPAQRPYPPTAQHAVRMGRQLAGNLARALRGQEPRLCRIRAQGALAALGYHTGAAQIYGLRFSGFFAWFLWRTVYLFKMPTLRRKVRVSIDWAMELVFAREFVQLGLYHGPGRPVQEEQDPEAPTAQAA